MRVRLYLIILLLASQTAIAQKYGGPRIIQPGITEGLTLINPTNHTKAYLIDECGRVINTWTSQYAAAHTIYLKPNGTLVRTNLLVNTIVDGGGGSGGGVEILDWDSNLLWSYAYSTDKVRQHHDIQVMPNGNILILAWEVKTAAEAIAAGRNPALIPSGQVWPEHLVEVRPIVPNGGEIVWEWHAADHLVQDFDNTKANYGDPAIHPELIDFNFTLDGNKDWIHANGIDYNQQLDQIIISAHSFNEIWVIDHGTTTAQSRSHTGGKQNKGGDLLYRWGNPMTYRQGTSADTKLLAQHNPHWVPQGLPQQGRIMYFNNGPNRFYSSIETIETPVNADGSYNLTTNAFGPASPSFAYTGTPQTSFFSRIMGSGQFLPNGNLFIGSSLQGITWEISPTNQILWEYKSPITPTGIVGRDYFPTNGNYSSRPIFRSTKYLRSYSAFDGRILVPQEPIEGEPWADCGLITALPNENPKVVSFPNPVDDKLTINVPGCFHASLVDNLGKKVFDADGENQMVIVTSSMPAGLYLLRVKDKIEKVIIRH